MIHTHADSQGSSLLDIREADWLSEQSVLMYLREQVFVHEQGVPIALELDEHDPVCLHLLARYAEKPIGTGRLLDDGHIGRIAVLSQYRGQGIGQALLEALIKKAVQRGLGEIKLNAQVQAISFYRRAGFIPISSVFMDAGIPHRKMRLQSARSLHGMKD